MSMQQALGVIGGVVGAFFGYPQLGFVVGSLIGAALTPKEKIEGPRIDDVKVSVSQYGGGIPETWGNNVPPATWIWSTDIIEIGTTTSQGKGGGVENTTYRQFLHGLLCLGKSPEPGTSVSIRKVWVDGKLRYDSSTGISVGQALATQENPFATIALLPGFEDQLPVAIIENYEGIGNVPAFRGVMSLFVFGLEAPGGRIPQLSFELCVGADIVVIKSEYCSRTDDRVAGESLIGLCGPTEIVHSYIETTGYPRRFRSWMGTSGALTPIGTFPEVESYSSAHPTAGLIPVNGRQEFIQVAFDSQANYDSSLLTVYVVNATSGASSALASLHLVGDTLNSFRWACYDEANGDYYLIPNFGSTQPSFYAIRGAESIELPMPAAGFGPCAAFDGKVHFIQAAGTQVTQVDGTSGIAIDTLTLPGAVAIVSGSALMCANERGVFALAVGTGGGSTQGIYVRAASSYVLLTSDAIVPGSPLYSTFYANEQFAIVGPSVLSGVVYYFMIRFGGIVPVPATVAQIIESHSLRAGLQSGQFDVTAIDDTVWGYTTVTPASARSNIAPLMTYGAIASVEEDGLIRYFHRADQSSVATIAWDELGAAEVDQDSAEPFGLSRSDASVCPRSVTVAYLNPDFDYQTSTETARRIVVDSELDEQVEIAVAMSPDQAATIARRILYERWVTQMTRSASLTRKYVYLSPGDVVTVEYPKGTLSNWMISGVTDDGVVIKIEVFPADAELLMQTVTGSNGNGGQVLDPLVPPTNIVMVDSAIVRDDDNDAGFYVAAKGYGPGWRGYTLYAGNDDTDLQDRGTVTTPAEIGFAETVLGAWSLNFMDEVNTVTLNMGDSALASVARELIFTGKSNLAAFGADGRWEILQFRSATDLGSGLFRINSLLRGLYGTERFTGTHQLGDRLVLLSTAGMLRPNMEIGALGQLHSYRPVSIGRQFDTTPSIQFANNGEGLKPLSPWDARKSKAANNDQTLTWERRTRLSSNALRGLIPLGENTEAYSLDFYTSSTFATLAGTVASSSRSLTLTSAQQTALGLAPGGTLYTRIYQLSDGIGRGAPLQAVL